MKASEYVSRLNEACTYVKSRIPGRPDVGLILGSGLGSYGDELRDPIVIHYRDIPGMLDTTVPGHTGRLIFGGVGDRRVLCLSGRSHQYEGLYPHEVQFAIRLLAVSGCRLSILTNASGTRDPGVNVGDLTPLTDHINMTRRGYTEEPLVQRDFDHTIQEGLYDAAAAEAARAVCAELGLQPRSCVYCYNFGPNFESHAEVTGEGVLGATNFGMSTVPEVLAMKQLGAPVFALSMATNKAAGTEPESALSHDDVQRAANAGEPQMKALISEVIKRVPLSDFAVPVVAGGGHLIGRVQPSEFVSDFSAVLPLFGGTQIDAAVVIGACHGLAGFEPALEISVAELPHFPVLDRPTALLRIGAYRGKRIAVVDGLKTLCGPDVFQLHYFAQLFKALGAAAFIQTFTSGALKPSPVAVVRDVVPFIERPVKAPIVGSGPLGVVDGVPQVVIASYHGPEFPTRCEVAALGVLGADGVVLGTVKGLLIASGLGLRAVGVADAAFSAPLGPGDTLDAILTSSRGLSAAVEEVVAREIDAVPASAAAAPSFAPGDAKGITWNDTPLAPQNRQEDPDVVKQIADALPPLDAALIFPAEGAFFAAVAGRLGETAQAGAYAIRYGSLFGVRVAAAIGTRELVRAFAARNIIAVALAPVLATDPTIAGEKFVAFIDHISITGISPLAGPNRSGLRFNDAGHLYVPIPGLKTVTVFSVVDLRETTPAYAAAIVKMKAHAAAEFGPAEALVTRHAGGRLKAIGVVVQNATDDWAVDDAVLEAALK
jgi:purine-nucleoside phosphorylase